MLLAAAAAAASTDVKLLLVNRQHCNQHLSFCLVWLHIVIDKYKTRTTVQLTMHAHKLGRLGKMPGFEESSLQSFTAYFLFVSCVGTVMHLMLHGCDLALCVCTAINGSTIFIILLCTSRACY